MIFIKFNLQKSKSVLNKFEQFRSRTLKIKKRFFRNFKNEVEDHAYTYIYF